MQVFKSCLTQLPGNPFLIVRETFFSWRSPQESCLQLWRRHHTILGLAKEEISVARYPAINGITDGTGDDPESCQ